MPLLLRRDVTQGFSRRGLVTLGAALCVPRSVLGAPLETAAAKRESDGPARDVPFELLEIPVPNAPARLGRALVLLPKARQSKAELPLLVLLHGLGETRDPRLGLRAWLEPYGLGRAWERLASGVIRREKHDYLSDEELATLNAQLAARAFSGMCVVCPFLPNPYANGASAAALDRYAIWVAEGLLPAVRAQIPEASRAVAKTGIAGVSLGGFAALEVALRRPELYATVGTVQGAFSVQGARGYAKRLAALANRHRIWVSTSTLDPYRKANEVLLKELEKLSLPVSFAIRKGPHNQPWLQEIGSLETLLWHDRALRGSHE